jgi:hypothetical protein
MLACLKQLIRATTVCAASSVAMSRGVNLTPASASDSIDVEKSGPAG